MSQKSPYKAFVSSTYEDLKEHRAHVIWQLQRAGFFVDPMEMWTAETKAPKHFSQDRLEGCDLCVVLVAFRRGHVPEGETRSITQLEYEAAVKRDIDIVPFLLDEKSPWLAEFDERRDDKELIAWRAGLQKKHGFERFTLEPHSIDLMGALSRWLTKKTGGGMDPVAPKKIEWPKNESPYPGLFHFTRKYAPVFFGRDAEVRAILDLLAEPETRFMIISGDSGVGKSSVVDAGVLPEVEKAGLPGKKDCLCVRMVPSQQDQPLKAMLSALSALITHAGLRPNTLLEEITQAPDTLGAHITTIMKDGASSRVLLLFIDQMEELFTSQDLTQANRFLAALYQAAQEKALWVIGTIRSDHLHYCHRHPDMLKVLNSNGHYALGPVQPYMMQDMILKPAQAVGLTMTETFAKRLIHDTEAESANLPLLAFVLEQLFQKRINHELSEKVYEELGGISGAIATHVRTIEDKIQKTVGVKAAEVLPALFHALVNVQKEEGIPTRNRQKKHEFPDHLQPVINQLVTERLFRTEGEGEDATISISHEKLFDAWPALKEYVGTKNKELVDRTLLDSRAKKWVRMGKPPFSGLATGREYHDFLKAGFAGNALTREFLQASRRARHLWMGGILVILLLLSGVTWMWQKGYNMEQALLKVRSLVVSIHVPPEMVSISDGTFRQGDVEKLGEAWRNPVREVALKAFAMGKYEVTFEEYDRFTIATGREIPNDQGWGRGQRPIINVSWEDAKAYAAWLSEETGKGYRLPSESEWEYVVRSGDKQEAWGGTSDETQLQEYAVYVANSGDRTAEVGEVKGRKHNKFGLYDLSGNVWEWVEDCSHGTYEGAPTDGSAWLEGEGGNCGRRMIRGGSWLYFPVNLRSSNRGRNTTDNRNDNLGFRLAQGTP